MEQTNAELANGLARDVERLQSLRAVKDLQRSYAQYCQFGLWDEVAALFAQRASLHWGEEIVEGRDAISAWFMERGGGRNGMAPGALHTELIDEPLVNLSVDGRTAKGRWMRMALLGDGKGAARIEGGIFENDYAREGGVWRLAALRYFPQYEGNYAQGWTNVGNADLPIVPFHFTIDETGTPIPPAEGPAPRSNATLADLEQRIAALNAEDCVRNLQHAYGYYVDRKMWDDVVDLFAADCAVEIAGRGVFRGQEGVRRALELMGPAGLKRGELNDRALFDTIVRVAPGAQEAMSRGTELGMLSHPETGGAWEVRVFRNRFVKEGALWKFKELRLFPLMHAGYAEGWGTVGVAGRSTQVLPAFAGPNPATGLPVTASGLELAAASPLTGAPPPAQPESHGTDETQRLAEARRRYQRSMAFDGTESVSSAYGYYLDDFQWTEMSSIFAEKGNKQSPFAGYYLGRDRIMGAANAMWGPAPKMRARIAYHWRTQPVIHVSHDGRSANLRTRLFQPRTSKATTERGPFSGAGIGAGMYPNDQAVLENGIWRLWSLTIDEHYFHTDDWKSGWAGVKEPEPGAEARPSPLVTKYPPDILLTDLGRREEGFRGGTGETIAWPGILPMWFHYRNPVSGRVPERYWPDCVPYEKLPESRMTRHGYQMPPTGPESDGTELP